MWIFSEFLKLRERVQFVNGDPQIEVIDDLIRFQHVPMILGLIFTQFGTIMQCLLKTEIVIFLTFVKINRTNFIKSYFNIFAIFSWEETQLKALCSLHFKTSIRCSRCP